MNPNHVSISSNRNTNNNSNQQPVYMPFNQLTDQNTSNYLTTFTGQHQNQRQQVIDPKF
jgi:hypothetical protein